MNCLKKIVLLLSFSFSLIPFCFSAIQIESSLLKNRMAIGLNLSSNGIGAEYAYSLLKNGRLNLRMEGRYYKKNIPTWESEWHHSPTIVLVNGFIKRGSIGILLDYHPFNNKFKLTTGFSYLMNQVYNTSIAKDSIRQGNIKISPEEMGTLNYGYQLMPSPYFGMGIGRAIPKKRFGFNFEIGFYYTNIPEITVTGTKMLEPISGKLGYLLYDDITKILQPFLPVLNFG